MIGWHLQNGTSGWLEATAKLPDGTWIKAVDGVQKLSEAKAANPNCKTVLRHWYDAGQQFDGGFDGNVIRARDFFATFIDGTFRDHAHNVDAIEGFNEYLANSQNEAEIQQRIDWVTAAAWVWETDYRSQPDYAHIRLVIANAAVGNDIPLGMAQVAIQYDCILGYHAYIPCRDNGVWYVDGTVNEFPLLSGRWIEMDNRFKAAGYECDWLFTEGGIVGAYPGGHLGGQDGWRTDWVLNSDPDLYVQMLEYWLDKTSVWNVANNSRALGMVLFTSGGSNEWEDHETGQPEMNQIAEWQANYDWPDVEPPVEPPPIDPPIEPDCKGLPREQYTRRFLTLPQDATLERFLEICEEAYKDKSTVGFSYDDAGIGALENKTARLYDIPEDRKQEFVDWYAEHYEGTVVEFLPKV